MNINPISKPVNAALKKVESSSNAIIDAAEDCLQGGAHYGKHKVKRYLYHFTNEAHYENILKSGQIDTSTDAYLDYDGVFLSELENVAKCWRTSKDWNQLMPKNKDGIYLSLGLLGHVSKKSDKVVCLRIPTKYLDHDMLMIRSQNKLCKCALSREIIPHIKTGMLSKFSNLYKQRKEAIEYIYKEDIPVDKIEFVGVGDFPYLKLEDVIVMPKEEQRNIVLNVLKKIFTGQPEATGLDRIF